MMAKSPSSAGDLAQQLLDHLEKHFGADAAWIEGEDDTIGVTDSDGVQLFVKVELA